VWVNGVAVIRDGQHTGAKPRASRAAGTVEVRLTTGRGLWGEPPGGPPGTERDEASRCCEPREGPQSSLTPSSWYTAASAAPDRAQV